MSKKSTLERPLDAESSMGSVTRQLTLLKAGDRDRAPHVIFSRYQERLVRLANQVLHGSPQTALTAEDTVLHAMDRFFQATYRNQFPELHDRHNLWALLVKITVRTAINQRRAERRRMHGTLGARPVGYRGTLSAGGPVPESACVDPGPPPDLFLEAAEQCEQLMGRLLRQELISVAALKLQEFTHREIADRLAVSERTVERRVALIRKCWLRALSNEEPSK